MLRLSYKNTTTINNFEGKKTLIRYLLTPGKGLQVACCPEVNYDALQLLTGWTSLDFRGNGLKKHEPLLCESEVFKNSWSSFLDTHSHADEDKKQNVCIVALKRHESSSKKKESNGQNPRFSEEKSVHALALSVLSQ